MSPNTTVCKSFLRFRRWLFSFNLPIVFGNRTGQTRFIGFRGSEHEHQVQRNTAQRSACLQRDENLCVLTKSTEPEVCDIIPFWWNNSSNAIGKTTRQLSSISDFLSVKQSVELYDLLTSEPGCSDKTWNMISLNPRLHESWIKGYWAFKYLGTETKDTQGTPRPWTPRPLRSLDRHTWSHSNSDGCQGVEIGDHYTPLTKLTGRGRAKKEVESSTGCTRTRLRNARPSTSGMITLSS